MKGLKIYLWMGLTFLALSISCQTKENPELIVLSNDKVSLVQNRKGGAFTSFLLADKKLNPFNWVLPVSEQPEINKNGFDFQGHFISLGTWGLPTEEEQREGIRLYGEPTAQIWSFEEVERDGFGTRTYKTGFKSKIEGLSLIREVSLYDNQSLVRVIESVTNDLPKGIPYNFLQHPTFGGAFVSSKLSVDTNAGIGFYQKGNFPRENYENLEASSFVWPQGELPNDTIDLRKTGEIPNTFLTSHIFEKNQKLGWATATNPEEGVMVGYVWETNDYPWLNVWHQYKDGKVTGRAVEFATCGLGLPFEELLTENYSFYHENSFEFIDAKETIEKSYYLFTMPVESNFSETIDISILQKKLVIRYNTENGLQMKSFKMGS